MWYNQISQENTYTIELVYKQNKLLSQFKDRKSYES